eukprot:2931923-Amphidinium_carterae.1
MSMREVADAAIAVNIGSVQKLHQHDTLHHCTNCYNKQAQCAMQQPGERRACSTRLERPPGKRSDEDGQ